MKTDERKKKVVERRRGDYDRWEERWDQRERDKVERVFKKDRDRTRKGGWI